MSKNGSIWPWLIGGAAVAGGIAWATSASAKSPEAPPAPPKPLEPSWMSDTWVRNTLMTESGQQARTDGYQGYEYKIVPLSYGTVNGVLMMDFAKPEQLEPAAQILRKIMGPDGLHARKVLLKSGSKTLDVKW
jgi:hypothetical protein